MYYTNGKNFVFNHLLYIFHNAFKAKIKSFILNSIVPEVTIKCEQDPLVYIYYNVLLLVYNRIGGVMVSVLASSVVDRVFDLTEDYKIGICCFSAKHTAFRRQSKDWLAPNQDNVSEWGDMSICGLLFQ
jgi:hypothetical protein